MTGAERRLVLGQPEPRGHPHAALAVHRRVVGDGRVVPVQLVAPVRRRHRHRLRLARRHLRVEHGNPQFLRRVLQRVDDEEAVVAPVDAVDRAVGVGRRVALVGGQLVVGECGRAAPVPHRQHQVPLAALRARRRRRHLAGGDPVGPPREHLEAALAAEPRNHAAHPAAILSGLHAPIPGLDARRERPERFGDLARRLVAQLVAHVAVGLDLVDPVVLRDHLRRDSVARRSGAGKLAFRRDVDQGVPVAGGIDLRCGARVGRNARRQRQTSPRHGAHRRRIDQSVAADPDAEGGLGRQVGQEVSPQVVGHDDLAELRGRIGGLGNHPDAGFRSPRACHRPADVVGVDRHARSGASRLLAPTSPTTRRRPRRRQESTATVSTSRCSSWTTLEVRCVIRTCRLPCSARAAGTRTTGGCGRGTRGRLR